MTEESGNYAQPPSAIELRRECLTLIERLYRHPLNIKLLLAARSALLVIVGYKAGRSARFAERAPPIE